MQEGWQKTALLFLTSQAVTLFGSTLVQMAVVWTITMETASGLWVAAFSAAAYLPQFVLSLFAGAWADRWNKKWMILGADAATALVTLAMVLTLEQAENAGVLLPALLGMTFLRSCGAGVQTPAVQAVIPQLVPPASRMRVNGINATMQALVNFGAPIAAGAVLALWSLRWTLMIDVLTALLGTTVLVFLRLPVVRPDSTASTAVLRETLRGFWKRRQLRTMLGLYGLFTIFCVPAGFLAGLFVRRTFQASYWALSLVEVVGFVGMTLGGVLMSTWGGFRDRLRTLTLGLGLFGGLTILLGLAVRLDGYLLTMFFYGVAMTMVQVTLTTLFQESVAPDEHGRLFGLLGSIYAGALPFGMVVFGALADGVSLRGIMVVSGLAVLLAAGQTRRMFSQQR